MSDYEYKPWLPEGEVTAEITSIEFGNPPWPGDDREFMHVHFVEESTGKSARAGADAPFKSEGQKNFIVKQMKGIGVDDPQKIKDEAAGLVHNIVEVFAQTKPAYREGAKPRQQYYFRGVKGRAEYDAVEALKAAVEAEEIPVV